MVVVVRLLGGLGNQLFQYAAGLSLAAHHRTELRLDTYFLETGRKDRPYNLDRFCIEEEFASQRDIARFPGARSDSLGSVRYLLQRTLRPYYRRPVFVERGFAFDPNFFRTSEDVYVVGYWQSEKYFSRIRDILLKKLALKEQMSGESQSVADTISQTHAVSVHVRRGDYASDPRTNQRHGTCPPEYYESCAKLAKERMPDPHFFVFSDEPDWAMQNLKLGDESTFVTSSGPSRAHEDLKLMSMCQGHILANSSFSWWGAWLNPDPNKLVLSPRRWFNEESIDTRDLVPEGWVRV